MPSTGCSDFCHSSSFSRLIPQLSRHHIIPMPETSPPRHLPQVEFANNPPRRLPRHVEGAPRSLLLNLVCGSRIARKRRIGDPALVVIAIGGRAKTVKTTPPGPSGLHRAQ